MPRGKHASDDRAPFIEEIRQLFHYPDIRIKPIVLFMLSCGARIGAWDYLKWKHIIPMKNREGSTVAAKVTVYAGEPESYITFITPECYIAIKTWMIIDLLMGRELQMIAG